MKLRVLTALTVAVVGFAVVQTAAAQAPPVSGAMLDKCFSESGGWVRDDLMVGTPCAPFKNRGRVLAYVKNLLIYNGFRPSMTVKTYWARQIRLLAIQDGITYWVYIVKSGPHQIGVQRYASATGRQLDRLNVSFDV
jgi:hypothetical protein